MVRINAQIVEKVYNKLIKEFHADFKDLIGGEGIIVGIDESKFGLRN